MPAVDNVNAFLASGPLSNLANVTPSDSEDLAFVTRALYVGAAGAVAVDTAGGETVTVTLAAGWHPIRVSRIWSTGTTATGVVAGW